MHARSLPLSAALILAVSVPAQVSWNQVAGTSPSPRSGHGLADALTIGQTIMFGGRIGSATTHETWNWTLAQGWTQLSPTQHPSPREQFAFAYDIAGGRTLLHGGSGSLFYGDTWEWDGNNWNQLSPANSPGTRSAHSMVYDVTGNRMVLFGGWVGGKPSAETWIWDGLDWSKASPTTVPPGRAGHSMAYDVSRKRVVMYGGVGNGRILEDTWEWDGNNWIERITISPPGRRTWASMTYDWLRQRTILFGGERGPTYLNDTWDWDGTTWAQRITQVSPSGRASATMTYVVGSTQTLLFGGTSGTMVLGETWEYSADLPASYRRFGVGCAGSGGTPALNAAPNSLPWIDDTFTIDIRQLPAGQPTAILIGGSNTSWLGAPLPFDLTVVGMPGCWLYSSAEFTFPLPPGTNASWSMPLPDDPTLLGFTFYNQALAVDPGANPTGAITSNGGAGTIGGR